MGFLIDSVSGVSCRHAVVLCLFQLLWARRAARQSEILISTSRDDGSGLHSDSGSSPFLRRILWSKAVSGEGRRPLPAFQQATFKAGG